MGRIIKVVNGFTYEQVIGLGNIVECEKDCKVGDIINNCFVYVNKSCSNVFKKGDYVLLIPLYLLAVVETETDLTEYGFYKSKQNGRWINCK